MTGFARRDFSTAELKGSMQVKSYNNRFLDMAVFLPPYLSALEPRIRAFAAERVVHGKLEIGIRVRETSIPLSVGVDESAVKSCAEALRRVAELSGLPGEFSARDLLSFEGVFATDRELDAEAIWTGLEPELARCFADYDATRVREGQSTREDLERNLATIKASLAIVEGKAPELEAGYRQTLVTKFAELSEGSMDQTRLMSEIAAFLTRYTIAEELSRLRAHIAAFEAAMRESAPGKKLDFICQEMNRESNTIGSKNVLVEIGAAVIELKSAIENIREQVRNVE